MKRRTLDAIVAITALFGHASAARNVRGRGSPALTRFVDEDVAEGGISDVAPLCDDPEDCSNRDETVQADLIEALEKDSQVTVVRDVELGELVCESLKGASQASLLRFTISSNETVIAERTFFTEVDGDVFTNDEGRQVWMGVVVDPEPAEDDFPRTVSMTWADECDVETFLLNVVRRNTDGTTSIIKSVPCAAGSSTSICLVELQVEFEEEREPEPPGETSDAITVRGLLTTGRVFESKDDTEEMAEHRAKAEDIRLLNEYLSATAEEKEEFHAQGLRRLDGDMVVMPSGRRLTCSTQLDLLVLYSTDAMEDLGDISAEQMESVITAAVATTNEATVNSEISATINLVHVAQLPYEQDRFTTIALLSLKSNADVSALRDTYHADVVQLIGDFGPCGYGALFDGTDESAFSVVTGTCLDNFSHTHEIGHNVGCYHNRENTNFNVEYAHGHRYCEGTVSDSYRTVMSYECENDNIPRVNYFSNPDVIYLDKPTGTDTEDNARAFNLNMLTVANYRSAEGCNANGDTCSSAGECCIGTCSDEGICEAIGCNGDPHLVGFHGQKFDFTGEDGLWYALVSDGPCHRTNIRITAPVPEAPEITYITGVALSLCDAEGDKHTVEITVSNPHSLDSSCPEQEQGGSCIAEGALRVVLDGEEMTQPGQVDLADGLSFAAANLPGACRSFGFEKYWLSKEKAAKEINHARRRLKEEKPIEAVPMSAWIASDPGQTNVDECREYVARSEARGTIFDHQSEHASMQIASPQLSLRVSHGKVHQLPMRDPSDRYDLPDHVAFQMNIVFEDIRLGSDPQGLVGETTTPVLDAEGVPVMRGLGAIRGTEGDYLLSGPFEHDFAQLRANTWGQRALPL